MPAERIGRVTAAAKTPSNGAGPSSEPASADGATAPLPLLTRYSLRLMTFVVDAVPVVPPRSTSPDVAALEQKSASCRLLLSPAASHSGFEDHFQSDQFHYIHHKYFDWNFGPSDVPTLRLEP